MAEWIISHYPCSSEMELMKQEEALLPTRNYSTTLFWEMNRVRWVNEDIERAGGEKTLVSSPMNHWLCKF